VIIFDLSYNILAYSDNYEINNIHWSEIINQGYCSYEFINAIQKLDDVKNSPIDTTSFEVQCSLDPMKKLCSKIFNNQQLIAYVMMFENKTNISRKHH